MDERKIQEVIQRGRDFLKSQDTAELERNGSDYKTDQELKKPQPPLVKAPMTENRIDLPRNFESLSLEDNLYQLLAKRKSSRVYTQEDMASSPSVARATPPSAPPPAAGPGTPLRPTCWCARWRACCPGPITTCP